MVTVAGEPNVLPLAPDKFTVKFLAVVLRTALLMMGMLMLRLVASPLPQLKLPEVLV